MFPALTTFQDLKPVFIKERQSRMYGVLPFYLTKNLVDLPAQIIIPLIMGTVIYWIVGFSSNAGKFFIFLIILVLVVQVKQNLNVHFISCV